MMARCNYCDQEAEDRGWKGRVGYKYDARRAPLSGWHCGYCAGPLRPKRKDEHESSTVSASWGPPKRVRAVKP